MSLNTIISVYLYSTKRTIYAVVLNLARSFGFTMLITLLLPLAFGGEFAWFIFGIYETLSFALVVILMLVLERKRLFINKDIFDFDEEKTKDGRKRNR